MSKSSPNTNEPPEINEELAAFLIRDQMPQWSHLPVNPVLNGGASNATFHLGENMSIRMPRYEYKAAQLEAEFEWLPKKSQRLSLPISRPIVMGEPAFNYPWRWGIYGWIEGDMALPENVPDMVVFAEDLARFLKALQGIDSHGGPLSGARNSYRGCSLSFYDDESRKAIELLRGRIDEHAALELWETALASEWTRPPVWLHGDIGAENLLVREGRLCGVIDFGNFGIGDPACDLAMCWNNFESEARDAFRSILPLDAETWNRGRGWVLWKAMIIASGVCGDGNAEDMKWAMPIIKRTLDDHKKQQ